MRILSSRAHPTENNWCVIKRAIKKQPKARLQGLYFCCCVLYYGGKSDGCVENGKGRQTLCQGGKPFSASKGQLSIVNEGILDGTEK